MEISILLIVALFGVETAAAVAASLNVTAVERLIETSNAQALRRRILVFPGLIRAGAECE
jgi:hypothetical protein